MRTSYDFQKSPEFWVFMGSLIVAQVVSMTLCLLWLNKVLPHWQTTALEVGRPYLMVCISLPVSYAALGLTGFVGIWIIRLFRHPDYNGWLKRFS